MNLNEAFPKRDKRHYPKPIMEKQLRSGCLKICADDDLEWLMVFLLSALKSKHLQWKLQAVTQMTWLRPKTSDA
ncbi:hypothetical protein LB507_009442 [Fusarium sp. FIESC RH6]|nr:hypothetical protein LB507_009442 [Fusarium sp. FIESC RH6]